MATEFSQIVDLSHIASGVVGGLAVALIAHFLTKDRERHRDDKLRQQSANDGDAGRRREFLSLVLNCKSQIEMSDDPGYWVNFFKDQAAPEIQSGFDQVRSGLSGGDKVKISEAVAGVLAFAKMHGSDIYANKSGLLEAFTKFPDA